MLSDSDLVAELLAREVDAGASLDEALRRGAREASKGAFSMVILEANEVHAVRDPYGFRPLCLGRLGTTDAPEGLDRRLGVAGPRRGRRHASCARSTPARWSPSPKTASRRCSCSNRPVGKQKLCIFEFVYFARPDAYLMGHQVHTTRRRMGELLAGQSRVDADLVMGVPDSGVPAAEGYAKASGIPFGYGLVKNRYIGRTFIAPDQDKRAASVRRKLNPLRENIEGQRLVVVDDSIVRGTTTKALVTMLRDAGAKEVHLRISSPPFIWPCYYGIDTPNRDELLAANHSIDEMNDFIGSDSLEYITLENLRAAIQLDGECCDACLTGSYPAPIPVTIGAAGSRW